MGGGRGGLSGQGVRRRRVKCPSGRGAGVCVLGAAGGRCRAAVSASLGVKGLVPLLVPAAALSSGHPSRWSGERAGEPPA